MSSHLSKTEYEIMEYFWGMGDKYTFGELMKYFNEKLEETDIEYFFKPSH